MDDPANNDWQAIARTDYIRQRLAPSWADPFYLHLSDLRLALEPYAGDEALCLLDFGCGGSPYRPLFPHADYRRADFAASSGLDYIITEDSKVTEDPATFDIVLSTQVLEHAASPEVYLAECCRLLKPGGRLICTTHGTYEDHGCPDDYHRWTAQGLERAMERAGFSVQQLMKLTTGPRALLYLLEQQGLALRTKTEGDFASAISDTLSLLSAQRAEFHQWCDTEFAGHRVVDSSAKDHVFYIALLAEGTKEQTQPDGAS